MSPDQSKCGSISREVRHQSKNYMTIYKMRKLGCIHILEPVEAVYSLLRTILDDEIEIIAQRMILN